MNFLDFLLCPIHRAFRKGWASRPLKLAAMALLLPLVAHADDGHDAWLRYAPVANPAQYSSLPGEIVTSCQDPISANAAHELARGLTSMLGRPFTVSNASTPRAILLSCAATDLPKEGFAIHPTDSGLQIAAGSPQGLLFGVFRALEDVAIGQPLAGASAPSAPIRWVDQWDNPDGTIERGYAGPSIFFAGGHIRPDLTRAAAYARLLASIGINGLNVNNVNADLQTLSTEHLHEFARLADALRPWGVRLALSVDLSSPQTVGHLPTFDPIDPTVARWWQGKVDELYTLIPDFAGFTVKADSEGRAGPSQYGRTPAQAANVLARALKPHNGVVLYRGFVYNHHLDFHDLKADRARAGYDNFRQLDGQFEPNVIIQIKHGPIDFQVREAVSPLFAALQHTSQAIELQTSQEYTGQQRHMVFLIPMWKWVLDTDLRAQNRATPVKEIVEGHSFHQPLGGFVSVVNAGMEPNWLHHPMALANLYGYGALAWNPDQTSKEIVDRWTRLTFGNDPHVVDVVTRLQLGSWHTYESYTGPFGIGTLTDIIGVHYGPGVGSAENNGWGQWFRADHQGVGMDRTVATGTGYIGQYPPELARVYESLATCPEDLLLFLHHVPYTHPMHEGANAGKTLIQAFYDRHDQGAREAATYPARWQALQGLIDPQQFALTEQLLSYQAGHAEVWRDAVNTWFERISGIPDAHAPRHLRYEAESAQLASFRAVEVLPSETASGGRAVVCDAPTCSLSQQVTQPAGTYRIQVGYFDIHPGTARYTLLVNGHELAHFAADQTLPPAVADPHPDGHTATRFISPPVALKPGDTLTLQATPDGTDNAPVDYLELIPATAP